MKLFEDPQIRWPLLRRDEAISYLPVLPPLWSALPRDHHIYCCPSPLQSIPRLLELDANASCYCSNPRITYSPAHISEVHICTIYTITCAHSTSIQLQHCPTCPPRFRRFIGPETRDMGIFNFNNRILFTHDLLDEYTSAFASSETPFVAWVATMSRRYKVHNSSEPFVSEKMFRSIWFSFVKLQALDTDSQCPSCGPEPEDTIWDGVTLAFSRKHLLPTLRPPTVTHGQSLQRTEVRYHSGLQLIPEQKLRKAVRSVVQGQSLVMHSDDEDTNGQNHRNMTDKAKHDLLARVESVPDICAQLKQVNEALGNVFSTYFGIAALATSREAPHVYKKLYVQVSLNEYLYYV